MITHSTVLALHCFMLPCVPIKMQGVGLLDFISGYSTIVYLTFLFLTLSCRVLTYSSEEVCFLRQLASYLLLAWEPACSRRLLPSQRTSQRHALGASSLPSPKQRPYRPSLLLPCPRTIVTVEWATDKNHKKVTRAQVHEKEEAAWAVLYEAAMSPSPGSARGTRSANSDTSSEPPLFPESLSQDGGRIAPPT